MNAVDGNDDDDNDDDKAFLGETRIGKKQRTGCTNRHLASKYQEEEASTYKQE